MVSTYQAGQLVAVGVADGQLTFSFRGFDRAMGIAVGADRIAVGGKEQIWSLREHSELAPAIAPAAATTGAGCPAPRPSPAAIQCHEIAWGTTDSRRAGPVDRQHSLLLPGRPRPPLQLRAALAAAVHLSSWPRRTAVT